MSLFLATLLSLSLFTFGPVTPTPPQEPDPTPVVTIQPEEPGDPPIAPQGLPDGNGNMPDPKPIDDGGD